MNSLLNKWIGVTVCLEKDLKVIYSVITKNGCEKYVNLVTAEISHVRKCHNMHFILNYFEFLELHCAVQYTIKLIVARDL